MRGAAALVLTLAGLAGPLGSPPAQASTSTIPLRAVGGDGEITAAWGRVAGVTSYTVHWGVGTSTAHAVHTTGTSLRIGGLVDRRSYSLRVTADGSSASSARRTATPVPYVPTSISSVTAVPAGADRIRVTWRGGTQARSFAIIGGSDSMTTLNHFATAWHPAALQSWTVTIPRRLHDVLGGGSGNAVFLKVALSNSTATDPAKHLTFDLADRYRVTPSGTWSFAGMPADRRRYSKISVASWNVQSASASAGFTTADRWPSRLPRVAASIESIRPDLIGLQELTTTAVAPTATPQYQTLQTALRTAAVPYRNAREDADTWLSTYRRQHPGTQAYVDSQLFYNPDRLTLLDAGFISPRTIMGPAWPSSTSDEVGMWARLRKVGTDAVFTAASLHLPAGGSAPASALRRAEATAIGAWLDGKAAGEPIVLVGDLNANGATDSDAGSLRLRADGYVDAGATTDRGGYSYSSSNGTNGTDGADPGYPIHAVRHPYPTSRIDYILLKNSPFTFRYRNEVRLISGARFDPRYQGSDHNMQFAIVGIATPGNGS